MHPLVQLARKALTVYVREGKKIDPPTDLSPEMREQAGVFVSLKKFGQLRGCIGTFTPTTNNVAEEVIKNAIAAATQDPRFHPVEEDELEDITCSVDVLSEPEKVTDRSELDPRRYGVIVVKDFFKGLLLPDLEGVDTVEEQLRIAKMKAGISPSDEDYEIYRFEVSRYH
jgi:AmmeMemoRadiSam system protein A